MLGFFKTFIFLIVATLLSAIALLLPAHLRSIDSVVLEHHFNTEPLLETKLNATLSSAHIGPAQRIVTATDTKTDYQTQILDLVRRNPDLRISGGPDRSFEEFLDLTQMEGKAVENTSIISILLPRSERASLAGMLQASSNANVKALLEARNMVGLIRLHPANHAAGAPFDSGILTLALLIEGGHFRPSLATQIGTTASQASMRTPAAILAIEDLVIATLSLGRQLEFRSLADLASIAQAPADWAQMATLFRAQPDRINQLFTVISFDQGSTPLFSYLSKYPDTANADIDFAIRNGPAAVDTLLETMLPVYQSKGLAKLMLNRIEGLRPQALVNLAANQRQSALGLRWGLFFMAGLAFAFAMGAAWRASFRGVPQVSRALPSVLARDVFIALVVALTLWALFEPEILQSQNKNEADPTPRIEFAVADSLQALKQPVKAMQELNTVTLLVLALFFIVQLIIYCFCLIKLKEITKQNLSPELKLKLLENEENLFDFGLYIGLGGTVLSLILVAVGVVEASLMAAYASTLFGILFVALLKVINLRPYRRQLIMQAGINNSNSNLMNDIKL